MERGGDAGGLGQLVERQFGQQAPLFALDDVDGGAVVLLAQRNRHRVARRQRRLGAEHGQRFAFRPALNRIRKNKKESVFVEESRNGNGGIPRICRGDMNEKS